MRLNEDDLQKVFTAVVDRHFTVLRARLDRCELALAKQPDADGMIPDYETEACSLAVLHEAFVHDFKAAGGCEDEAYTMLGRAHIRFLQEHRPDSPLLRPPTTLPA